MKKILYILIAVAFATSCDKVYINGDLDGMWHLESVTYPDHTATPDMVFYSFQRHLAQVSEHHSTDLPNRFRCDLTYTGSTLIMSNFHHFPYEAATMETEMLAPFHIFSDTIIFEILTLNEECLIIKSEERVYTLRKW